MSPTKISTPVQHIGFQKINADENRATAAKPASVGGDLQPAAGAHPRSTIAMPGFNN